MNNSNSNSNFTLEYREYILPDEFPVLVLAPKNAVFTGNFSQPERNRTHPPSGREIELLAQYITFVPGKGENNGKGFIEKGRVGMYVRRI